MGRLLQLITFAVLITHACLQASRFWAAGSDSEEESESEVEETSSEEASDSSSSSDEGSQKKGPSRYDRANFEIRLSALLQSLMHVIVACKVTPICYAMLFAGL